MPRILAMTLAATAAAALACTAVAQPRPKAPPPPPPPQSAPPNLGLFPCRTEKEICFVGAVKDGKLVVLFTNDAKAEEIIGKPLAAATGEGPSLDLAANEGRVVMMTGTYDPKAGLSKAEIVDVASPLVGFAIKANIGAGGDDDGPPAPPPPPPPAKKR